MGTRTVRYIAGQVNLIPRVRDVLSKHLSDRVRDFHIGISEPEVDTFYLQLDVSGIDNIDKYQEELYKSKYFRGITRTEKPGVILIGLKEFYPGSIAKFIDGRYSQMYPDDAPITSFIMFPEAVNVLTKEAVSYNDVVYDKKTQLEESLDIHLPDDAELDSPPDLELEIYNGSIEPLQ